MDRLWPPCLLGVSSRIVVVPAEHPPSLEVRTAAYGCGSAVVDRLNVGLRLLIGSTLASMDAGVGALAVAFVAVVVVGWWMVHVALRLSEIRDLLHALVEEATGEEGGLPE
jgi:hypothetical protein